ncbi:hypothetical protein A0H81_00190 [Grifola frondosa]|uniref:Uncharacterized protein n=1 Tax=Grifola frondosa TaxID=5627 RepID=A0A1C7MR22_GRIFR|nr:hypothetical protein A0H81_00190 [Grifola frondosa]
MNGGSSATSQGMTPIPQATIKHAHESTLKPILMLGSSLAHAQNGQTGSTNGGQAAVIQEDQPGPLYGGLPTAQVHVEDEFTPHTEPTMRPRMTIDLQDDPMDMLFDRKLSVEGSSPKPCIVPGNALHLIDDDPTPRSQTPSSVIIFADDLNHPPGADADRNSSEPLPPSRPAPRVRFRSRVRITSGVHRHRHSASTATGNGTATPCSSASDSPSSSISAPLRYQADENTGWGPIGKRLSAYAGGWQRRVVVAPRERQEQVRRVGLRAASGPDERTPLIGAAQHATYVDTDGEGSHLGEGEDSRILDPEERSLRAAALRREEEVVFGKWPWRLFNKHWWWWHIEPVLCCCCSDDADYEEY